MNKIDLKNIDRKIGLEVFDYFRDGVSSDFDEIKISSILSSLIEKVNDLIDDNEALKISVLNLMKLNNEKIKIIKKRGRPKLTNIK